MDKTPMMYMWLGTDINELDRETLIEALGQCISENARLTQSVSERSDAHMQDLFKMARQRTNAAFQGFGQPT